MSQERDKAIKSKLAQIEAAKQDKLVEMKNEYNKLKEKEARKMQRRDQMFKGNAPLMKVYEKGAQSVNKRIRQLLGYMKERLNRYKMK
jgi:DNA-binding transcriptional regulator YbjK